MTSVIQRLHDSEIGGWITWPDLERLHVRLGCPVAQRVDAEAYVESFAEAERWMHETAVRQHPSSEYAKAAHGPSASHSVIDRLFKAGIPGEVSWYFDGAFGASLGGAAGKEPVTDGFRSDESLRTWAAVERWLGKEAQRRKLLARL